MAALVTSALAGALVAASWFGGRYALAAGVAVVQVLLVVGLARTVEVPAGRTSSVVALLAGLGAGGYVVATAEGPFDPATMAPVLVAVGAGFVGMVIVQLARQDGRERLTPSLTFGVTALILSTAAVGWLALGDDSVGEALLLVGLTGAAVAAAIMIFPGPGPLWVIGGTIAAASVGLILPTYVEPIDDADLGLLVAAVTAGACGFASTVGVWTARLLREDRSLGRQASGATHAPLLPWVHVVTVSAMPLALAGPAAVAAAWAFSEGLLT
jgi:hypothetical protein